MIPQFYSESWRERWKAFEPSYVWSPYYPVEFKTWKTPVEVAMSPKADLEYMSLLTEMTAFLDSVETKKGWGIALCPSDTVALTCAHILATLIPEGTKFSGRAAVLPFGRVSVVCASDPVFLKDPFWLAFVGWETNDKVEDSVKWRDAATEILGSK